MKKNQLVKLCEKVDFMNKEILCIVNIHENKSLMMLKKLKYI